MAEEQVNTPNKTQPVKRVIEVVPYNHEWKIQFEQIRDVLAKHLGSLVLGIEHVGSTSVPGLASKPILDIDIFISSRDELQNVINALSQLGYDHKGDLGIAGREAFSRRDKMVPYDGSNREWEVHHHLYVCARDSKELISHIAFRNYLRQNPEEVLEYSNVKKRAAKFYPHDIEGYMAYKAECIELILSKTKGLEREVVEYLNSVREAKG